MAATLLGLIDTYAPGATTEIDAVTGITLVRNRTLPASEAYDLNAHPAIGSAISHLNSTLTLRKISLRTVEGGMVEAAYSYANSAELSNPNTDPAGGVGIGGAAESYDLDVSLEAVSVLRWGFTKYAISGTDRRVLTSMVQLGLLDENGTARRNSLSDGTNANLIADKIENGEISVNSPVYVWRVRRTGASWVIPYRIGKISTPPGPVPTIDGNWLFMGATASGLENRAAEMQLTWQSSIDGSEWDSDFYAD